MKRILITGSRDFQKPFLIEQAILRECINKHRVVVIHGGATGADAHAQSVIDEYQFILGERYPADWDGPCRFSECEPGHRRKRYNDSDYCPAAGNYRNQKMVDLGADVCLAFPLPGSRGTWDCVQRAEKAGIAVKVFK